MTRDPRAYLADVLDAGQAIQAAVATINFDEYCSSRLIRSAVEREFMIVGEALKQLSQRNPKLFACIGQGPEIIAFRNKLSHEYLSINNELVWGVIQSELPDLIERCHTLLQLLET
jgi:uncharacterized protein with HEPN domain